MFAVFSAGKLFNDCVIIFAESMTVINKGRVNGAANLLEDWQYLSKFLSSTCRGIPAPSKHSLLEYWAFAQHWRSTVTILIVYTLSNNKAANINDALLFRSQTCFNSKWSDLLGEFQVKNKILCKINTCKINGLLTKKVSWIVSVLFFYIFLNYKTFF